MTEAADGASAATPRRGSQHEAGGTTARGQKRPTREIPRSSATRNTAGQRLPRGSKQDGLREPARPVGRAAVVEAIVDATIALCVEGGPDAVTLRRVAERANVNYGLVHRHFGSKSAVIRAAMARVWERAYPIVESATDFASGIERVLYQSSGQVSKIVAWGVLQGEADDVIPREPLALRRLTELAIQKYQPATASEALETRVLLATIVSAILGWRLFEPYLTRGFGLDHLERIELLSMIDPVLKRLVNS